jgi:uncharacterized integral membrane protein
MLLIALLNGLEADHKSEEVAKARDEAYSDPILRGRNFHDSYLIRSLLPPSENELLVKTLICILVLLAAIVLLNTSFTEHGYFGGPNTLYTILIVFAAVPMGHAFGICIVRLIRRLRT